MTAGNNGKVIWLQKTTEKWYDCRKQWKGDLQSYHLSIVSCSHIAFPLFSAVISPFHYFLQSYHLSIIFCSHITFPLFSAVITPFHYFLQLYHLSYGKVIWLQKTMERWYGCRKQWKGDMAAENNGKVIWLQKIMERWYGCRK
jgi:hypothetical protein